MAGTRTIFGYVAIPLLLFFVSTPCAVTSLNVNNRCIKEERDALLKIRKDLNDPSNCLSSWVGRDCCNWTGIECDNQTDHVLKLDLDLSHICSITGIFLSSPLDGNLNPSLTDLKHLSHLDLSYNNFQGIPIPKFIGSLSMLHYLDLSYTNFSGTVPPHLGNLSNLQYLDISSYTWSLQSDRSLSWLSGLSSLQHLDLSGVNITSTSQELFHAVNMIPSLLELRLSYCNLFTLPSSLSFDNLISLSVLDLSWNNFHSPIPSWLFNVSTLTQLDLSTSSLRGPLPELGRGNLCKLQSLDLSGNVYLTGDITQMMDALSSCSNHSLKKLDLSSNQLTGKLPNSFRQFDNLHFLHLSSNSLSGPIPPSIGNLSNLVILDLQKNKMNGTIPESIGQLSQLSFLQLLQNFWEGTMTNIHFRNLTNLNHFAISSYKSSFALKLAHDWAPPSKLSELEIRDCQVGPTFPNWLRNIPRSLQYVILENAGISGEAPQWFFNLSSQIQQLDLSHNKISGYLPKALNFSLSTSIDLAFNQLRGSIPLWSGAIVALHLRNNLLSGPIPANIGQEMSNLEELDLSNNQLNGSIRLSISRIQKLRYLDLSNNYFTGEIPISWMGMKSLEIIDLSNNTLTGGIPTSICSLPSLFTLKLGNNNLSADLSLAFQNCTQLMITLDLRYNRLYGSIQNLPLVTELLLRGNTLTGSIPEELCRLSLLHLLDLAENSLSGSIPPCLGDVFGFKVPPSVFNYVIYPFGSILGSVPYTRHTELVLKGTQLEYFNLVPVLSTIDLSNNNFSGEIPNKLTELVHLGVLNLSWNQLTGNIPYNIGSLTDLESLDLSHNHLSGPIPPSMTSMTFLGHLNLSYNNLSGQIPVKNQFGTFTDPSIYEGNQHLCGDLLPNKCSSSSSSPAGNGGGQEIKHEGDRHKMERLGLYVSIVLGYITGFWIVCGSLVLKRSWRHAYFRFMYDMRDRLLVMITVNLVRVKRKFGLETN